MSGWVYFVFVMVGIFGRAKGTAAIVAWAIVMLALLAAIVIGEMGWPT